MAVKRPGLRRVRPRSEPVVAMATFQPVVHRAEHVAVGDEDVVEEDLGEAVVAVEPGHRAHGDAGGAERDEEVGHALVALGGGIGAEEAEEVVAERAAGAPRLLPAEPPSAARSSRTARLLMPARSLPAFGSDQPWAQRSSAGGHAREHARLLLGRAELEEGRREEEDAVLAHALRRAGAVVLLLEDQPLEEARLTPAVLARPGDDGPARLEEPLLPLHVEREALGRVAGGQRARWHVRLEPSARTSARNASSRWL